MSPPRLHEDEVTIDESVARRLLAEQLPSYADWPLERVASGGTKNVVFRLGRDMSLRMPMRPDAVSSLQKEVRWLPVVAPHLSLPVPEIVATGEPGEGYPFPWAVVRWLEGADALSPRGSLTELARTLGRFVTDLQNIDMTNAPPPGSEGFVRGLPLHGRDETFRASLSQCEGLLDIDRVRQVWDDALDAPDWDGAPVWLHADLIPGNLLVARAEWSGCSTSVPWRRGTRPTT